MRYPLRSVVVIALMAMVCGCDDAEAFELWGEANAEWLGSFLALPHGTPSQDVFLAVFAALDERAFGAVLRSWADLVASRLRAEGKHIAIDGKTSRGSASSRRAEPSPLHTVSAYLSEAGLVLGQVKTPESSNELAAMPELLRLLDLRGATVTIDALGCQTELARTIVDGGGHYLLAAKGNQPTLHADVVATFAEADDPRPRAVDEEPRPGVELYEEVDKGHGRLEKRTVALCRNLAWMTRADAWSHLACVVRITRERTVLATGQRSSESAFYIGSDPQLSAAVAARTIRRHWSIENELHWVLDMAFGEDRARHRARNTAANMTVLRHFALNLVKQDQGRKVGVANSRKRAGFDRSYLLHLLMGAQTA